MKEGRNAASGIEQNIGSSLLLIQSGRELEEATLSGQIKQAIRQAKQAAIDPAYARLAGEFNTILQNQNIRTVYQPIVSLSDASVFGYEALTRLSHESLFRSPLELFQFAEREGSIYSLDRLAREKAILGYRPERREQKIFINIPVQIIYDQHFSPGQTLKLLEASGLDPSSVVFEITERSSIEDFTTVKRLLSHYRSQGYRIAIDDAGAGYSSLQAIAELQPEYVKIDRSLIEHIHRDKIKENIVETFVSFAQKMNIYLIAEGIDSMDDLIALTRMGVHYGQGYLLAKPNEQPVPIEHEVIHQIQQQKKINKSSHCARIIGDLAADLHSFHPHTCVSEVSGFFAEHSSRLGAVIAEDGVPVGLIMKEKLHQQLASPYGLSLYMKRAISTIMDHEPLIVDESLPVEQVSQIAMERDLHKLYDLVIITRNGKLVGGASIRSILECITNVRMEHARVSNPLTGLPGNVQIQREMNRRLLEKNKYRRR